MKVNKFCFIKINKKFKIKEIGENYEN